MKSISTKLFLALLGLTSVVLIATLLLAHWSFDQGFLNYIKGQEVLRLKNIARDLGDDYAANNFHWPADIEARFADTYKKWHPSSQRRKGPPPRFKPDEINSERAENTRKENRPHRDGQSKNTNRPPPEALERDFHRPPPPPRHEIGLLPNVKRDIPTILLDAKGQRLAGINTLPNTNQVVVEVMVDGNSVGSLKTIARLPSGQSLESTFSNQQTRASLFIALGSLMLAGLASFFIARMLLSPILSIKNSIAHLASGDYTNRLRTQRNDELGVLMNDIDNLAYTLEENRNSRRRWLADISHELRTPVTILTGEIEALKDGLRSLDMEQLTSFESEINRLRRLINDLYELSLSDIGGLRYEFKTLEFEEFVRKNIESNESRLLESGLSVELIANEPVQINGDAARLEQLLSNLLNNSLAYTDQPGKLQINIKKTPENAVITFSDTPPSVPNDKLESLFEPLYREDESRTRRTSGAGLGLSICRNIIQAHKGNVMAKPSSLGGLCIEITLPIKR